MQQMLKHFFVGCVSWFIVFPCIILNALLIHSLLHLFNVESATDQVAVKILKQSVGQPDFLLTLFSIVLIVPCVEELLFRGFFLSWLKKIFGPVTAILFSAAVFAISHFSTVQKYENISIVSSIFILGCFLGRLKEKQGSLWAPIGLHITFNLIGSLIILNAV